MGYKVHTFNQHIDGFVFGAIGMKPGKDRIRIDGYIQVIHKFPENHSLLASTMGSHPQPAIAHVIVYEENITFLETQFIGLWHFCIRQDGYDALFIVNWLRRSNWYGQSFAL